MKMSSIINWRSGEKIVGWFSVTWWHIRLYDELIDHNKTSLNILPLRTKTSKNSDNLPIRTLSLRKSSRISKFVQAESTVDKGN